MTGRAYDVPRTVVFPLRLTPSGTTATTRDGRVVVQQLLEQLLFTAPGERVNRPSLGCGLNAAVFAPLDPHLVTATQFQIQSEIQTWLGDLVRDVVVEVTASGSTLDVAVSYRLPDAEGVATVRFTR